MAVAPEGARDGIVEVRWGVGLDERLSMDLSPAVVTGLRRLPGAFSHMRFEGALGGRATARLILRHLLRRGIVVRERAPKARAHVEEPGPTSRIVTAWQAPAGARRIVTRPIEVPAGVVPLAYVGASIDGEWTGFGVSPDPGVAERTARYEALERFAVLHPELTRSTPSARHLASLQAAITTAPGLMFEFFREVAPPAPTGEPRERFRLARSIVGRRARGLVPIEWIYLGRSPAASTNGTAFGLTLGAAIQSAQRELVERDLLLRAWYGLVRSQEITRDLVRHPAIERWRFAALAMGLSPRWFLLGGDGGALTTVVCVVGSGEPPHFGSGSATRPDVVSASEKAFLEAAGSHLGHVMAARRLGRQRFVRAALKRAAGAPGAFRLSAFESYWAARVPEGLAEIAERFSRPRVRRTESFDPSEGLWVDATPSGLERGHVVKVFHPDAVPLPKSMAQAITLERLLGVRGDGTPPPIS